MTPEERDRLTRLEVEVEQLTTKLGKMDEKLDRLVTAAVMGKGAWWLILKIGGILSFVVYVAMNVWDRMVSG